MHIVNIALMDDIDLLREYIELSGDNMDVMGYLDFKEIFGECKEDISKLIYELYISNDECHAASIVHNLKDIERRRLVNIGMIPKEDLKIIIESGLAVFSTYHLFGDIPPEYYSLLTLDMIDEDEFIALLPLSHRPELSDILNSNPSLSTLFGPYLSCTLHDCENVDLLTRFERIITVPDSTYNAPELEDEGSSLEEYLKTGKGKEDIHPEYEDNVYITSTREIDLIDELGYEISNKLHLELDILVSKVPNKYLDILNKFEGFNRCLDEANLEDAIRWFSTISNANINIFINTNSCTTIHNYDKEGLYKLWEKYHSDPTLIKLVLKSLPLVTCQELVPNIPQEYYKFLHNK